MMTLANRPRPHTAWRAVLSLLTLSLLAACDSSGELTLRSLFPEAGRIQGDERVTIEGKNFRTDIGYTVYFGPSRSKKVAVIDDGTLVAFTPRADGPGAVDVSIRGEDGTALVIRGGFTYQDVTGTEGGNAKPAPAEAAPTLVH